MAAVGDYTVDVESTGKASTVLDEYGMDMQTPADSIESQAMPAAPAAGVSIVGTLKSVRGSWHHALSSLSDEMKGLATTCGGAVKIYHESEETVTYYFRPGQTFTPLSR